MELGTDTRTVVRLRPTGAHRRRAGDVPFPVAPTDRSLLLRAGAGDTAAWDALVAAHAEQVWRWARSACADRRQAEQVCEDLWLRLAQSLPRRAREPLGPWLHLNVAQLAAHPYAPSVYVPRQPTELEPFGAAPRGVPCVT